jgi:hypothetical protein
MYSPVPPVITGLSLYALCPCESVSQHLRFQYVELALQLKNCIAAGMHLVHVILILPIPGEAKAKAMPGWLYIHTINNNKPLLCPI